MTEREWARQIVHSVGSPVVLELGAHHGNDTVAIYDACPRRPLYVAVEADPRNIPPLVNRVEHRKIHVAHYAIAAHCGTVTLHLSGGDPAATGSSSIRPPKDHLVHFPRTTFADSVEVPALTLDALAERYQVQGVDLIWSDLQGAERDMIEGGQETLKRTLYLLCECDRMEMYEGQVTRDKLLELLPGWEVVDEWPANANVLLANKALL